MPKRRRIPKRERAAVLESQNGRCADCGAEIAGGAFDIDHTVALALGGADDRSNYQALCHPCHHTKTRGFGGDISRIAKAKRVAAKHNGTWRAPRRRIPGHKGDKWKRKLNGTTERRSPTDTPTGLSE